MGSSNSTASGSDSHSQPAPSGGLQGHYKSRPTFKFRAIADNYQTVDQVQNALREQGLESSNLIVAVDFTKSNEWTGKRSFNGRSLHAVGAQPNPYEDVIRIISRTLSPFDDDNLIPCYGFGNDATGDRAVFSFLPDDSPLQGLDAVLWRYRELVPYVRLAGPTSFAPAILQACRIVERSGGQYHMLLIVADGQVTRSSDLADQESSVQEQATIDAIVTASNYPLSIVMVGVGDGPWDLMHEFDDRLPQRKFDNFQFVNFTAMQATYSSEPARLDAAFSLRALMELPEQYKLIQRLGLLSGRMQPVHCLAPLQPPIQKVATPPQSAHVPFGPPAPAPPSQAAPPSMFLCPITQEFMQDPVIAADGHTYERSAIQAWLSNHNTSPLTNVALPNPNLIPNHGLRSAIQEYTQRHRYSLP